MASDESEPSKVVFDGKKMVTRAQDLLEEEVPFILDAAQEPGTIDFKPKDSDCEIRGIYQIEGDRLKMCLSIAGKRPTHFKTKDGDDDVFIVLERERK